MTKKPKTSFLVEFQSYYVFIAKNDGLYCNNNLYISVMYHQNKVMYHIYPFSTDFLALFQSYIILLGISLPQS